MKIKPPELNFYTPEQLAQKLGCNVTDIWRYSKTCQLPLSVISLGWDISYIAYHNIDEGYVNSNCRFVDSGELLELTLPTICELLKTKKLVEPKFQFEGLGKGEYFCACDGDSGYCRILREKSNCGPDNKIEISIDDIVIDSVHAEDFIDQVSESREADVTSNSHTTSYSEPVQEDIIKNNITSENQIKAEISQDVSPENYFTKSGEYWKVRYRNGKESIIRDRDGMVYMQHLLLHLKKIFSGSDLSILKNKRDLSTADFEDYKGMSCDELEKEGMSVKSGDFTENIFDDKGQEIIRKRKKLLQNRLDDAAEIGNAEEIDKCKEEMEKFEDSIKADFGRKTKTNQYRESDTVSKAISRAIKKISEENLELSQHLSNSIKTGSTFHYNPENSSIIWK